MGLRKFLLIILYDFDWGWINSGIDPVTVRPTYDELITMAQVSIDHWGKDVAKVRTVAHRLRITLA